jgi:hypothetical protein
MTWTPEQLLARADLLDRVSEGSKNAEYLDTLRMEAWALRRAAAQLAMICGCCGDVWQDGMSCGQKDNGWPFQTCYPAAAPVADAPPMSAAQFEDNLKRST